MIREIMKDEAFPRQKAEPATKDDFQAATGNQFVQFIRKTPCQIVKCID